MSDDNKEPTLETLVAPAVPEDTQPRQEMRARGRLGRRMPLETAVTTRATHPTVTDLLLAEGVIQPDAAHKAMINYARDSIGIRMTTADAVALQNLRRRVNRIAHRDQPARPADPAQDRGATSAAREAAKDRARSEREERGQSTSPSPTKASHRSET